MKIHFDEQTVEVEAGAVMLHFNVVNDEAVEAPVEEPVVTPVEEAPEEAASAA